MEFAIYYLELPVAIIRLFIILIGILICTEIIKKTTGELKNALILFLISSIPAIFYTLGRIINIESMFSAGKLISLTLSTLTSMFVLLGLMSLKGLVNNLEKTENKIKSLDAKSREIVSSVENLKLRVFSLKGAYEKRYISKEEYKKGNERIREEYGNLKEKYSQIYKDYCSGFGK
ncbi:MAG: hypothetical protein NTU63_03045 [Candidatus Pacearchaeota archaeon]|nr:hypothetical protein [Candidatus Pacearchaeota archaeon]